MLEITGDDIATLTDSDLRILVGRLCEAELRKHGLSTCYVRYGGHQDAVDGGVDVDIELPEGSTISGFIPRPRVSFQVKREDMPRAKILDEMRPKGQCHSFFCETGAKSCFTAPLVTPSDDFSGHFRRRRI